MIKDTDLIVVRNRNRGTTGYTLDNNFHREFNYGESKKIPFEELKRLQYAPGGMKILNDCLVIENQEALDLLNMKVEPEYFYTPDKIEDLLFKGTYDEFADFLDFAPEGAIEIAKTIAVEKEMPDMKKREMLGEKTGVNINNAIMVNRVMNDETEKQEEKKERRVKVAEDVSEDVAKPERRVAAPKYNVVSTKK